ncbi:MAG: molecular chaperone DnaK [Cyanobacteria bacterium J06632_22]
MGKVVGIDLGTTNSVVAVLEGGKPVVVANTEGVRTTPSYVAFSKEGEKLVGQMARRQAVLNPQNTFYGVKRFIGRRYNELTSTSKKVPYTLRKDEVGNIKLRCPRLDNDFAPEEISAMILRKLADEASRYLGQPVTDAVITVPAYFNDAQRQATRDAGRIAGLEVKRILNEPTSAALAYGLDQQYNQTILVFDLGGGTFDVSILDVRNNVFEVKSTSGDTQLGGTNFDKKIVDWLADEFLDQEGVDLRRDRQALQRLTEAAEKAKVELSGLPSAEINLPFITATADGPKHIETKLSRSQFEGLCADLVGRLRGPLKQAMNDANLSPSQIDEVVLVGGSSRMPMVQALVRSVLSKEPSQNVNPDEAVAVGAAIQAGILTQEVQDIMLLDVTPLSLGLETIGGVMKKVIPRNTTIPVRRSDVFSTSENNQTVVEVHVLQGEREMVQDNKSLGRFKLMGIPPAPRGIPQVQVSFDIDANGILQVSALDKTTGREQSITVQEASNLNEDDIQRMIRDAEEYADTDRLQRERIEKRNRAETLTFTAERALREVALDFGLQFSRDRRRRIEGLVQDLREALKREDERTIDIAQSELQDEVYELNREAYMYDADDKDGDLFGQIGDTIKRVFSDDEDDYYRQGYGQYDQGYGNSWDQQARWDAPNWNAGQRNQSGWDDWGDDWNRPAAQRGGYQDPYGGRDNRDYRDASGGGRQTYGQDYQRGGYDQRQSYDRGVYGQDSYNRDSYGQDRYESERYNRTGYDAQPARPEQGGYEQGGYDRGSYDQGGYNRGGYDQRSADSSRYDNQRYSDRPSEPQRYDGQGGYSQDTYRPEGNRSDSYRQDNYRQDAYRQDNYSQDNYSTDRYSPNPYAQNPYPQEQSPQEQPPPDQSPQNRNRRQGYDAAPSSEYRDDRGQGERGQSDRSRYNDTRYTPQDSRPQENRYDSPRYDSPDDPQSPRYSENDSPPKEGRRQDGGWEPEPDPWASEASPGAARDRNSRPQRAPQTPPENPTDQPREPRPEPGRAPQGYSGNMGYPPASQGRSQGRGNYRNDEDWGDDGELW